MLKEWPQKKKAKDSIWCVFQCVSKTDSTRG